MYIYVCVCIIYMQWSKNSLQADQHFQLPGHNFNKHAKFTLIEQLNETNTDKEPLKYRLIYVFL